MSDLIAVTTSDLSYFTVGAILSEMVGLFTYLARLAGLANFGTVSSAMTFTITHSAFDGWLVLLDFLFRTLTATVSELFTIGALRYHPVQGQTCFGKTLQILFRRAWPSLREFGTLWLVRELEAHNVRLVGLALKIDDRVSVRDLLLLGDEVGLHSVLA